jgi:hypothetical protein
MANSRRESHHRNGITDLESLQQTSATKSALNVVSRTSRMLKIGQVADIAGDSFPARNFAVAFSASEARSGPLQTGHARVGFS